MNEHTGIPNINIPLYQVKSKQLSLDLSLSYHASGIRVDDIASWVGLGWVLGSGGVITRTVQGMPDDDGMGFYNQTVKYTADLDPQNDYYYMDAVAKNHRDVESDFYFINVNGITGKFIFNKDKEVLKIPQATYIVDDSDFPNGFTITADDGTIYEFYAKEITTNLDAYSVEQFTFTSSWYLTKVLSADRKDSIELVYSTDAMFIDKSYSYTDAAGPKYTGTAQYNAYYPEVEQLSNWSRYVYASRLDSIKFTNGLLTFSRSSRQDLPDSRLDEITIKKFDYGSQTYVTHRYIEFLNDDHFSYNNGNPIGVGPGAEPQHRLKLNGIIEKDALGTGIRKHTFYYNETLLPPKGSNAQDHWGFYNGETNNGSLIPTKTLNVGGFPYTVGDADREPNSSFTDACILEKIHFPTGGYTEFVYENHQFDDQGSNVTAGGLRIAQIKTYKYPGDTPVVETFKYGHNESGAGSLLIPKDFLSSYQQEKSHRLGYDPQCTYYETTRQYFYGHTVNALSTLNGSPVVYEEVTKYTGTPTTNQGKTINQFEPTIDGVLGVDKPYKNGRMITNEQWKGGNPISTEYYREGEASYFRSELSEYSVHSSIQDTGFKGGYRYIHDGCIKAASYAEFVNTFYYFDYPIYSGYKNLTSRTTVEKPESSGSDSLATLQTFNYDNLQHKQITRTITTDSEDQQVEVRYTYPQDYQDTLENFYTLEQKNIISIPVKTERVVDGKLVEASVTKYTDDGKPEEIYQYESATLSNAVDLDSTTLGLTSDYQKKATLAYDQTSGSLISIDKESGIKTSFAWGYHNSRPVVKADNVSQANLNTAISAAVSATPGSYSGLEDLLEGVGNMSQSSQRDTWESFNNALRSHANLTASLVTTYAYDPLLGMTSICGPSGLTTYYEYDNMGRLEDFDDLDDNLTTRYAYHYKGPPYLSTSTENLSFTPGGENKVVTLNTNLGWSASDNRSWISLNPTSGDESNTNLTVTATQNPTSAPRTGTVTVSDATGSGLPDQIISISQAGFNPTLEVSTTEIWYAGAGTQSFNITSNISWTISVFYYNDFGWVNVPYSGSGNATVNVTVSPVQKFEPWFAELTVSGSGISRYIDILYY